MSEVILEEKMTPVKAGKSGIFDPKVRVEDDVKAGDVLAEILDPYDGSIREQITSPVDGTVFFAHNNPMTYNHTVVYKVIGK